MTDAQLQPLYDLIREAVNSPEEDATVTISALALRKIAEELAALKAQQPVWQPIETAQKDSRAVLLWVPTNKCTFAAAYDDYRELWKIFGGASLDSSLMLRDATHWMPLPAPPGSSLPQPEVPA